MACFIKEISNNHRNILGVSDILMKIPPNNIQGISKKLVKIVLNCFHNQKVIYLNKYKFKLLCILTLKSLKSVPISIPIVCDNNPTINIISVYNANLGHSSGCPVK